MRSAGEDPDDSSYGWVMLATFTSAVLAITFAVCVLALARSWWVLGIVIAAHVGVTAIVMKVIYGAFVSAANRGPIARHDEPVAHDRCYSSMPTSVGSGRSVTPNVARTPSRSSLASETISLALAPPRLTSASACLLDRAARPRP